MSSLLPAVLAWYFPLPDFILKKTIASVISQGLFRYLSVMLKDVRLYDWSKRVVLNGVELLFVCLIHFL